MNRLLVGVLIVIFFVFAFRNFFDFFSNIMFHHDDISPYIKSELKLIKIENSIEIGNPIKIFENSMAKCVIKNFNENIEIGSYIIGYYSYDNPTNCLNDAQFSDLLQDRKDVKNLTTYTITIIFATFFTFAFLALAELIEIKYHKQINKFYKVCYKLIMNNKENTNDSNVMNDTKEDMLKTNNQFPEKKNE